MIERIKFNNPGILSAMAGITDAFFANRVAQYGAGGVTIGGFNIDGKTLNAAEKIVLSGRKEFLLPILDVFNEIKSQIQIIDKSCVVIINIRVVEEKALENLISSLLNEENKILIEINAHCRQPALLQVGAGENVLNNLPFIKKCALLCHESDFPISIKIRASSSDIIQISSQFSDWEIDFLHLDSYIPGKTGTDFQILEKLCKMISIPIIGNNSIWSAEIAKKVLELGCHAFSLARPAINDSKIVGRLGIGLK